MVVIIVIVIIIFVVLGNLGNSGNKSNESQYRMMASELVELIPTFLHMLDAKYYLHEINNMINDMCRLIDRRGLSSQEIEMIKKLYDSFFSDIKPKFYEVYGSGTVYDYTYNTYYKTPNGDNDFEIAKDLKKVLIKNVKNQNLILLIVVI